jgi:hypothetical protein
VKVHFREDVVAETSRTWIHNAKIIRFKYLKFHSIGFHGIKTYLATLVLRIIIDKAVYQMLQIGYNLITYQNR